MKSKKKKKKVKFIYKLIVGILFFVSILFIIGLMALNVLSMKWFMIVLGVLLFIILIIWFLLIKSKKKKVGGILAFFMIVILSLGSFYLFQMTGLLSGAFSNYKVYNYSVLVLDNSNYQKLKDLDGVAMGYLDNDTSEEEESLSHIGESITPDYVSFEDVEQMGENLLSSSVESILIEDSYLSMLEEENFAYSSECRVIYTFQVRVFIEDFSRDVDVAKETFSVFVSGIDTYGSVDSVSRSDVNMVVTVNPTTKQILLTSIPRDYYVSLHGISGYPDKLTHAGLYGIDMSVKTVEDLLNIEINYYIKVNFTSVIDIVDALGGVDVYSEYTFTSMDGYYYTKGYNTVNGEEALSFARERKAFASGDNQRIKNQQALLQALFQKCISKEIIYTYNKLLNSLSGSFVTNMSSSRITSLIRMQLDDMADWTVTSNCLTGTDSYNYTYSYASQKLYVMQPNEDSVEEAKAIIQLVYAGEVLENSYTASNGTSHDVTKSSGSSDSNSSFSDNSQTSSTSVIDTDDSDEEVVENDDEILSNDDTLYSDGDSENVEVDDSESSNDFLE